MTGGRCTWPSTKTAPASVEPYPSVKWRSSRDSTKAFISDEIGAEPVIAEMNRPPSRFWRSSASTSVSTAHRSASPVDLRSTWLWNSAKIMSQIRGTKLSCVGRTKVRSSRKVERSLLATKYPVPPAPSVAYRMPRPIMWLIGMKFSVIDGVAPSLPHIAIAERRHELVTRLSGYIAPLRRAGAAGGVDQECQRVVVFRDEGPHRRKPPAAVQDLGQRIDLNGVACFMKARRRSLERVTLVIDLRVVVEDDDPRHVLDGQHQFDCVVEEVDARRNHHRLGLVYDGPQLREGRAGLHGHRDRAEPDQRDVDRRVVDAGEAEQRDAVTRAHIVGQRIDHRADAFGQLGV